MGTEGSSNNTKQATINFDNPPFKIIFLSNYTPKAQNPQGFKLFSLKLYNAWRNVI